MLRGFSTTFKLLSHNFRRVCRSLVNLSGSRCRLDRVQSSDGDGLHQAGDRCRVSSSGVPRGGRGGCDGCRQPRLSTQSTHCLRPRPGLEQDQADVVQARDSAVHRGQVRLAALQNRHATVGQVPSLIRRSRVLLMF